MNFKRSLIYVAAFFIWQSGVILLQADASDEYALEFLNESKSITQGSLAIILVRSMGLEGKLPKAPLNDDYIELLDRNGIRPLEGWVPGRDLTNGDFAVILARAMGIDARRISANDICQDIREEIQKMWDLQRKQDGYHKSLKELFKDKRFFPYGPPENPFRLVYTDEDMDNRVDALIVPEGSPELDPRIAYMYALKIRGITLEGHVNKILNLKTIKRILRSPIFRNAPSCVATFAFQEPIETEAEAHVTPITAGGP